MLRNSTDHQNPYMGDYSVFYDVGNGSTYNITSYPIPLSFKTLQFIEEYITPCVCAVGIFFNVFAGLILRKTEFKKVTPFVYLLALCIIDSVYLTAKIIPNRLYNIYIVPGVCQIVYYLTFLSIFMEWWIIVMCLSERCLSLYSSRKSSKYCSAFRVKCAIISMSLLSIVAHLYHTWTSVVLQDEFGRKVCMVIPEFFQYLTLLRKLDVIFAFIIPFSLILIMFVILSIQLCRRKRNSKNDIRQFVTTSTTVAKRPVTLCVEDRGHVRRTPGGLNLRILLSKRQITMKLLFIVIMTIVLCVPHDILKAKLTLFNDQNASPNDERIALLFLNELYNVNFSLKGILCLLLFPSFRCITIQYLKMKLRSCCQRIFTRDANRDHDI